MDLHTDIYTAQDYLIVIVACMKVSVLQKKNYFNPQDKLWSHLSGPLILMKCEWLRTGAGCLIYNVYTPVYANT